MPQAATNTQRVVLGNAMILVIGQVVSTPLSIFTNAMMGRYIGPQEFGHLYLAQTAVSLGFLFVDWGTGSTLAASVARDRSRVGEFFGTVLGWRVAMGSLIGALLMAGSILFQYSSEFQVALGLTILISMISIVSGSCQDTIRGFERTDVVAHATVGGQFLVAVLVIPTLLMGGRLGVALCAQMLAGSIVLALLFRMLRTLDIGTISFRRDRIKTLLHEGWPFLFLGIAMQLQSNIDNAFLARNASVEAIGWYAASRRLVGVLVFPASALNIALYPTLCRLHTEDPEGYRRMLRTGLVSATVLVVPVAVGCALYPDLGIRIFSRDLFGPAEDNLRVLSGFVVLVYFTMVLGIAHLAAGRARAWAAIQLLCVGVSLALDPLLVPWFQRRSQNGGLGVCFANVASEVLMVVGGIWLAPRGIFDRAMLRQFALAGLAGGAMIAAARLLSGLPSIVGATAAVAVYGAVIVGTGGVSIHQLLAARDTIAQKFKKGSR